MIETYLLEYLKAFYEEGSLMQASLKLNVSQPSLTRAMQKLELELGCTIFDRTGNKISLNNNGIVLMDYVRDILALNKLLLEKAKELKEKELLINIDMVAPGIKFYYSYFFFNNTEKYKSNIIDLETCIKNVKEGLSDIAFINEYHNLDGLVCERIVTEKLYACLPVTHFLSKKDKVTLEELDGQSFLLSNSIGVWDTWVRNRLTKSKFFTLDQESLSEVVSLSSIPSFQTNLSMKFDNRADRVLIPIEDEDASLTFYAIYRKNKKHIFDLIKYTS